MPTDANQFYSHCDASDVGFGAILSPNQDGAKVVIAYASRTLSRAESNYDVTKCELLAIVVGLKVFRQYLLGRNFVIGTDHSELQWLRRTPEPMNQLARWLTFIEQYQFEFVHRPVAKHGNADGLSRRPNAQKGARSEALHHSGSKYDAHSEVLQVHRTTTSADPQPTGLSEPDRTLN